MHSRLALATAAALAAHTLPATLGAQTPAAGSIEPPLVGAQYSFTCTSGDGKSYNEDYRIVASDNNAIKVEVQTAGQRNSYEKPIAAIPTTIVDKETIGGSERNMSGTGNVSGLKPLSAGTNLTAYVTERRGGSTRINWNYKWSILGREVVYNRDFGDLGVVIVNEDRWADLYSSSMQTQYAPQIRFPIAWKYRDSNNASLECKLASAKGTGGEPVVAAAPPPPPPPPAAAPPPRQGARQQQQRPAAQTPAAAPPPAPPPAAAQTAAAAPAPRPAAVSAPAQPPSPYPAPPAAPQPAAAQPAPPPTTVAALTPPPAQPAPRPAAAAASADSTKQARLAQLQELLRQNVITREEYAQKEREIQTESPASNIAAELSEANRLFRDRRVTQDEFVQRRARALAKITPGEMQPKDALVLLNQLLEAQLISPTEHRAKRSLMLSAL